MTHRGPPRCRLRVAGGGNGGAGIVSILKFLGFGEAGGGPAVPPSAETESVRAIVRALDRLEPERAPLLPAPAYIRGRVARADLEISGTEAGEIERILVEQGDLAGFRPA